MKHDDIAGSGGHQRSEDPIARNPKDVGNPKEAILPIEVHRRQETQVLTHVPPGGSAQSFGSPHINQTGQSPAELLASILRFKWTVILVTILVSAPLIGLVWTNVVPQYKARAEIRVSPIIPRLVFRTDENGEMPFYDQFVNTQVSVIRSYGLLERVLERREVSETSWFQTPPQSLKDRLLGNPPMAPRERLRDAISARPRRGTQIIDISMTNPSRDEAIVLVDAILEEYVLYAKEASDKTEETLLSTLTDELTSLRNMILGLEGTIADLRRSLGAGDPQQLLSDKRFELDWTKSRARELQREIALLKEERDYLKGLADQALVVDSNEGVISSVASIGMQPHPQSQAGNADHAAIQSKLTWICRELGVDVYYVDNLNTREDLGQNHIRRIQWQQTISQLDQCSERLKDLIKRASASESKTVRIGSFGDPAPQGNEQRGVQGVEEDPDTFTIQSQIALLSRMLGVAVPEQLVSGTRASNEKGQVSLSELRQSLEFLKQGRGKLTEWASQDPTNQVDPVAVPRAESPDRPQYYEDVRWSALDRDVRTLVHQMGNELYGPNHPNLIRAEKDLEFTKSLRDEREKQLDELWEKSQKLRASTPEGPALVLPPGTVADEADNRYLEALQSVERQLVRAEAKLQWVLVDVDEQTREFDDLFEKGLLLQSELNELAQKRKLLDAVQNRVDQKDMERNVPASIQVLASAFASSQPSEDQRIMLTMMALVVGVGLGGGMAMLRALRSQTMRTPEDMFRVIQAPFLGHVPFIDTDKPLTGKGTSSQIESKRTFSLEFIRMIRTDLLSRLRGKKRHSVLITSSTEGTGKSSFTMMLGKSLAQSGKKVLIIDGDTYKRTLSDRSDFLERAGFVDSLKQSKICKEDLMPTETDGLCILPAGRRDEGVLFEEIANGVFKKCLTQLCNQYKYDIVLIDCPPVFPVADALIMASQVDGTIMVEREDVSYRANVVSAVARLGSSGGRLLGSVLVGSSAKRSGYGYHNSYGYAIKDS